MSELNIIDFLPYDTPEQTYTSLPTLQTSISSHRTHLSTNNTHNQFLLFSSVPASTTDSLSSTPHLLQHALLWSFNTLTSKIILKIQTPVLETAKADFVASFKAKLDLMGLLNDIVALGSPLVRTGPSGKSPDAAFSLKDFPPGRSPHWPTVVVEVGFLETSLPALHASARWWLENSTGHAGVVIVIAVHGTLPRLSLERWEYTTPGPLAGKMQEVVVELKPGQQVVVTGGPFRIPFGKVFLKEPDPAKGDIVLDEQDLESLARDVWGEQGFLDMKTGTA